MEKLSLQPWLKNLAEEDLPTDELKLVSAFCGMDAVISMLSNLQGLTIRIPTKGIIKLRNDYIKKQYDGTKSSLIRLAMEFKLDQRYVQQIINQKQNSP